MKRATALLILATALACLDPLYEDGMASGYFVCCQNGSVGTCACLPGASCLPTFKPCAGGRCTSTLSCRSADAGVGGGTSGTGGGSSAGGGLVAGGGTVTGGGSSAAGGLSGGGFVAAGGTSGGGFVTADSGTSDAGTVDGGSTGADAGSAGGGSAGGASSGGGSAGGGSAGGGSAAGGSAAGGSATGGGTAGGGVIVEPDYELCCLNGLVTTCVCAPTGCANAPFTACPANRCVAGTTTGICR